MAIICNVNEKESDEIRTGKSFGCEDF